MKTHLEFRSEPLMEDADQSGAPRGKKVAELIASRLPGLGIGVVDLQMEDWGWRVALQNADFPLWIGCGHYQEYPDGVLCFIEPSKPYVRRWLKRIPTTSAVSKIAAALQMIIKAEPSARELRWWDETEVQAGA